MTDDLNIEPVIVEVGWQGPKGAPGNAGSPYQWVVADESARLGIVPESAVDLHKLCLQLDAGETWRLAATDPPAWARFTQEPSTQPIDCGTFN